MARFHTFRWKTRFAARTVRGRGRRTRPTFRRKRAWRTVQTQRQRYFKRGRGTFKYRRPFKRRGHQSFVRNVTRTLQNGDNGLFMYERFTLRGIPEPMHKYISSASHYLLNRID